MFSGIFRGITSIATKGEERSEMIHIYNKYLAHTFSSTCSLASVVKQPIQSIYYIYNNNNKKKTLYSE